MTTTRIGILLVASLFALVSACGGGAGGLAGLSPTPSIGGGGSGGIGGSGLTTSGTIDGTGSIFVNGVRFEVGQAEIRIDGEPATEADLAPGMVVTVRGTLDEDDADQGIAEQVDYERDLVGPVDSIEISSDGSSMRLRILDRSIIAERVNTVFSGVDFNTIAVNDVVEVSGFTDEQDRIRATRIALDADFIPGQSGIKLRGAVSELAGTEFRAGDRVVRAGNATLVNLPGGALANGQRVEVTGTLEGNIITADRVTLVGSLVDNLQNGDDLRVQGAITDFVSRGNFRVRDIPINATGARLELGGQTLRDGLVVEVEGPWNGSVLNADRIQSRRGRIRAEARIGDIDATAGTITLQFVTGSVTLTTDDRTLVTDDDDDSEGFIGISALRTGDFLSAEALLNGSTLLATRVRREEDDEDDVLQGPVDSFVSGVSVTLLGVTFETLGAEFETINDIDVDAATFYASIGAGDLVRVEDEEPVDGIADAVEFESALSLDGDTEFPEDDSDEDEGDDSEEESDDNAEDGEDESRDEDDGSLEPDDDAEDDDVEDDDVEDDDAEDDNAEDDESDAEDDESDDNDD